MEFLGDLCCFGVFRQLGAENQCADGIGLLQGLLDLRRERCLYILLSDLDIEGKRTTNSVNGEGSMVKANQSMLADHWDTQEYVDVINGSYSSEEWLYQDVYILKNEDMVDRFVEVLMIDSVFAQSTEDYTRIEIPGLDQAWVTERLECIAVKGTTISIFTHPFDSPEGMREALEVVAEKWGK